MFDEFRWGGDPRERDDDTRDREPVGPPDAFVDKLNLPRWLERVVVRGRDRECGQHSRVGLRVQDAWPLSNQHVRSGPRLASCI